MILRRRSRGVALIHCAWQIALAESLFTGLVLSVSPRLAALENYVIYGAMVALALAIDWARGASISLPLLKMNVVEAVRRSGRQVFTVGVVLLVYLVAMKDVMISRSFLLTYAALLYPVLYFTNRFFPGWIARLVFSSKHRQATLVVGDASDVVRIKEWIARKREFGFDVVDTQPRQAVEIVAAHLVKSRARQLLLLGFPRTEGEAESYARMCDRLGVRLIILGDWLERFGRSLVVAEDEGLQFMSFQKDVLECPLNRVAKRVFDVVFASLVCVLVLPALSLMVWLCQRRQSPGPLFFRQTRTGAHGRDFVMIKFRTMHFAGGGDEHRQATREDERIFPAGRWLRKLSLDEMPQFLNVLKGEMSIVGPRPHMRGHDDVFAETATSYRLRQFIKPGITGLAQVRGCRGETTTTDDVTKRAEADLQYLENWSFLMDSLIVIKTAWQIVRPPKTAY